MEHRLILGGDEYLPFARSCITKLKKLGLPYADQSYEVGGASIKVRIEPGHEYIRIDGGVDTTYEFFASGSFWNPNRSLSGGGAQFDWLNQDGSAVRVTSKQGSKELLCVPLWSSIYPPDEADPKWTLRDRRWWASNQIYMGGRAGSENFLTTFSQPSEHFGSYHSYHDNKKTNLLTSCRPFGPGASTITPFNGHGTFHLSAIGVPYKISHFSFGTVPKEITQNIPPSVGAGDGATQIDGLFWSTDGLASGFSSTYPFAWTDTRVTSPPQCWRQGEFGTVTDDINLMSSAGGYTLYDRARIKDNQRYLLGSRLSPVSAGEDDLANTFDIPPAQYKNGKLNVGAGKAGEYIHWRSAATITVKDENGADVRLIVVTDTHNGFMFYPARNYAGEYDAPTTDSLGGAEGAASYRNIPSTEWVRVKPAMPAWVTLPDEGKPHANLSWLWRFNKDGTKAVSTPINAAPAKVWFDPEGVNGSGWQESNVFLSLEEAQGAAVSVGDLYSLRITTAEMNADFVAKWQLLNDTKPSYMIRMNEDPSPEGFVLFAKVGTAFHLMSSIDLSQYYSGTRELTSNPCSLVITPGDGFRELAEKYKAEPVMVVTPGLVEVSISATVTHDDNGKEIIDPKVKVIQSDFFSQSKKVYADAAYYVSTPREKKTSNSLVIQNLPEDDALLSSNIIVMGRGYVGVDEGIDQLWPASRAANAFYNVKNETTGDTVLTLCLAVQATVRSKGISDISGPGQLLLTIPLLFLATIVAHDLRYLSFITATYYRAERSFKQLRDSEPGGAAFTTTHTILPRFELRIPGEPLKTIDYGHSVYSGYADGGCDLSELTPDTDMTGDITVIDYSLSYSEFTSWTRRITSGVVAGSSGKRLAGEFGYIQSLGPDPLTSIKPDFQLGGARIESKITKSSSVVATHVVPEAYAHDLTLYQTNEYAQFSSVLIPYPTMREDYAATPEHRKLMALKFLPLVTSAQYETTFSFTPEGDYAVYFDARSAQFSSPKTTPIAGKGGVFDIIKINKNYTSHADTLNQAFRRTADPITMPVDVSEADAPKGVGRFGANGIFTYSVPQEKVLTGQKFKPE